MSRRALVQLPEFDLQFAVLDGAAASAPEDQVYLVHIEKAPAVLEELELGKRSAKDFLVSGLATHFGRRHLSTSHQIGLTKSLLGAFSGAPAAFFGQHIHSHLKQKRRKVGKVPQELTVAARVRELRGMGEVHAAANRSVQVIRHNPHW